MLKTFLSICAAAALLPPAAALGAMPEHLQSAETVARQTFNPACAVDVELASAPLGAEEGLPAAQGAFALGGPRRYGGYVGCKVVLDPSAPTWGPAKLCTILTHEFGHLTGYQDPVGFTRPDGYVDHDHSPDPASVMYPVPGRTADCHAYEWRITSDHNFRREITHFVRHAHCTRRGDITARRACVARKARYRRDLRRPPIR